MGQTQTSLNLNLWGSPKKGRPSNIWCQKVAAKIADAGNKTLAMNKLDCNEFDKALSLGVIGRYTPDWKIVLVWI